ncbi:MAG: response regulator [Deltaproteobacteria bacterium]|nr:response regulator [Deltaproteobacteria bacterium]
MAMVLVVENDISSLVAICAIVQKMGHTPIKALNGRIAWEFLESNHALIDLVITDIQMPDMDGYALIDRIRASKSFADMPIIVQSGYLGVKATRRLMGKNIDCVMPKPIETCFLKDYVNRYLH